MILIFDIIVWLLLWFYLCNKKYIAWKLSILLTPFLFIVIKSILLGIFLWLYYKYNKDFIIQYSFLINYVVSLFLLINIKFLKIKNIFEFNLQTVFSAIFLGITSILIYNVIPYGWDELMYHLPISIELLKKWSWMSDLWLSHYWHNNIRQWYPKNLYFVIDYFFVIFKQTIVWFQVYPVFALFWFFLSALKIFRYFFIKNEILNKDIALYSWVLACSIPVIYLHLFIKVDILFFSVVLLLIYNLLNFVNIYFVIILFFLILWLKIIGIYILWVIWISFFTYLLIFERQKFKDIFKLIYKNIFKIIIFSILIWWIFSYSFLYNAKFNWNFFYPVNIVHFADSGWYISLFWIRNYLRDFIFSDYWNYISLKSWLLTYMNIWAYNYDRWLWVMWFFFIVWIILYFLFWNKKQDKTNYFIYVLWIVFVWLSFSKLNILFWHRYQIFIYVLLTFVLVYALYSFNKKYYKFAIFIIIWANLILSFPYIWSFAEKYYGFKQMYKITTPNYCDKLDNIWDISRDDFRDWWKYLCKNIEKKNILTINQSFNFYLYWKNFDNNLFNELFYSKIEFENYIKEHKIDYIITWNRNNLYTKYWINKNTFYTNSTDANDEITNFCKKSNYENIIWLNIDYKLTNKDDVKFNFWLNNYNNSFILDWKNTKFSFPKTQINNLCLSIYDTPTKSLNNDLKKITINSLQLITESNEKINIDLTWFKFEKKAFEDYWLDDLWYKRVFSDDYNKIDYFYIWKKEN